jgi:hypothetical protein
MYLHIYSLFNGVDSESDHVASNHRMTKNSKGCGKKSIASELQALSRHFTGGNEENHEQFPSEESVFWSRLELVTPKCKIALESACSVTRATKL